MTPLTVSIVQTTSSDLDPEGTLKSGLAKAREAAERGSSLIVLPELWTGLGMTPQRTPEQIAGGARDAEQGLLRIAEKYGSHLVGSLYRLRRDGTIVNGAALVGPDGIVGVYEKSHLFDAKNRLDIDAATNESDKVSAGSVLQPFETPFGSMGLTICSDARFPEPYRLLAIRGARIVVNCSAFLAPRADHWEFMLRTRAVENQVFVLGSGQYGREPASGLGFVGRSMVIDPWGVVVAAASDREGIVTADIDLDMVDDIRRQFPLLEQRRPDLYGDIAAAIDGDGLVKG